MASNPKKLHLESLRGIAALCVALFHFRVGSLLENRFTDHAWMMVDFFFVLSGYVIALNYVHRIKTGLDVFRFQKRRFVRLYPLHFVTLLAVVVIELVKLVAERKMGLQASEPAFSKNDLPSFLQHLALLHNIVGTRLSWNFPSWSISSEFYTYLVFAVVILASRGRRWLRVVSYVLLFLFAGTMAWRYGLNSTEFGIYRCLLSFFLGALLVEFERRVTLRVHPLVAATALVLAVAAVTLSDLFTQDMLLLMPIVFTLLILTLNACPPSSRVIRFLSTRWLVYLGTISYGVYMIHSILWWWAKQALRFVVKVPTYIDPEGRTIIEIGNAFTATAIHVVGLAVLILLAHLSYRYLEAPLMRRFR